MSSFFQENFPDWERIQICFIFFFLFIVLIVFLLLLHLNAEKVKSTKKRNKRTSDAIKCVVVGEGKVGKTNLILGYLQHRFTTEHVPTASDIYNCKFHVNFRFIFFFSIFPLSFQSIMITLHKRPFEWNTQIIWFNIMYLRISMFSWS